MSEGQVPLACREISRLRRFAPSLEMTKEGGFVPLEMTKEGSFAPLEMTRVVISTEAAVRPRNGEIS